MMSAITKESPLVVLVTGAGAPGIRGTLYALRHNSDNVPVRIVAIDMNENAVGRYMVDAFYRVPSPGCAEYVGKIIDVCREENVQVVLPQTTREIAALSGLAERVLAETGARMVASASAA